MNPSEAWSEAYFLWDDFDHLVKLPRDASAKDIEKAIDIRKIQENGWLLEPVKNIGNLTGQESVNKLPYILGTRKLLFHSKHYIVALATAEAPKKQDAKDEPSSQDNSPVTLTDKDSRKVPPRVTDKIRIAWQTKGLHEEVASLQTSKDFSSKPLLFHTFDGIIADDETPVDPSLSILDHPTTKGILDYQQEVQKNNIPPIYGRGRLFVGEFAQGPTEIGLSNQIRWNDNLLQRLPFHTQCTGIEGLDHIMVAVYNRRIEFWDLSMPDLGPLVTHELTASQCQTKAIVDLAATAHYVAILDGKQHLSIIPIYGIVLKHLHNYLQAEKKKNPTLVNSVFVQRYLTKNHLDVVGQNLISEFHVPMAFSLGCNISDHEILYLGTTHGYVHELAIRQFFPDMDDIPETDVPKQLALTYLNTLARADGMGYNSLESLPNFKADRQEKLITITHAFTYTTLEGAAVQFISGRGRHVTCGESNHVYTFGNVDGDDYFHTETGGGYMSQVRNILAQGALVLIETNSRHLVIKNIYMEKQRTLPATIGCQLYGMDEESAEHTRIRDRATSLIYWDAATASIRVAYSTLVTETWQLPKYEL